MRRTLVSAACLCVVVSAVVVFVDLQRKSPIDILPKVYAQQACSVATLVGNYGFSGSGFVTTGPVPAGTSTSIPIAVAGVDTFDGAGNLSGTITSSIGGLISTSPVSGTYTVNANCTGTSAAPSGNASFVIVDHGKELRGVQTDPGVVAASTAVKQ